MTGRDEGLTRTELLRLKFGILEKYQAPNPGSTSIGDAEPPFCDFCGKAQNEVDGMVGNGTGCLHMCSECVMKAHQILFGVSSN